MEECRLLPDWVEEIFSDNSREREEQPLAQVFQARPFVQQLWGHGGLFIRHKCDTKTREKCFFLSIEMIQY